MTNQEQESKKRFVSYAIFVFAFVIVLINLISLVFPSLIVTLLDDSGLIGEPFEPSGWLYPLLITNLAILIFGILYFAKKLPHFVQKSINFIRNFEVSSNIAAIAVVGIIFGYAGLSIQDLSIDESIAYGDYKRVKEVIDKWPDSEGVDKSLYILHVKNGLLKLSEIIFHNLRVVPLLVSISLLIVTYFFTVQLTKKRFAGLVALIVLLQSYTFLVFDTLATYENSWTLFYLLSLYLIEKKWFLSPIAYVASLFSKPLTAAYFPLTLFYTYCSSIPRRSKIYVLCSYIIIALAAVLGLYVLEIEIGGGILQGQLNFDYIDFWSSFTTWSYQLRFETIFLLFILPLVVALFFTAQKGMPQAISVLALIAGLIISMSFLTAFTSFNLHPYRYVTLVVFFAIGVGTLLSKKSLNRSESGSN